MRKQSEKKKGKRKAEEKGKEEGQGNETISRSEAASLLCL